MGGNKSTSLVKKILGDILFFRWLRRVYEWVLHWADTPYGEPMLGFLSFIESSFFPIPPDVLLIPLAISRPKRAFRYAAITMVASVFGGMLGYAIGLFLWESVGIRIIQFYDLMDSYYVFREWYDRNVLAVTFLAGLTPLPYKVFTIAAGVMEANFGLFVLGSLVSRSIRFFMEAVFCYFGDFLSARVFRMPIRDAIDKYLNPLAVAFAVFLVAGFLVIKYILPSGTINLSTQAVLNPLGEVQVNFYSEHAEGAEGEVSQPLDYYLNLNSLEGRELITASVAIPGQQDLFPFHHGKPAVEVIRISDGEEVIALSFFTSCKETAPCTDGIMALYHVDRESKLVQDWYTIYPRLRHMDADHDLIGEADFRLVEEKEQGGPGLVCEISRNDVRFEGKGLERKKRVQAIHDRYFFQFSNGSLENIHFEQAREVE
jgi:membrane protein YqaA with SNARE-associated domain